MHAKLIMKVQVVIHGPRLLLSCSSASPSSLAQDQKYAHHFCHIPLTHMISVLHSYTGLRNFGKLTIFVSSGRKLYCSSVIPYYSISLTAQHVLNINWVALMWAFRILFLLLQNTGDTCIEDRFGPSYLGDISRADQG